MSNGRISGRVELRPIRLGLVIAPDSIDSLKRATRTASMYWGGRTFPIFPFDEDVHSLKRMAVLLGVDALVACDDHPRARELAALDGFSWLGFSDPANLDDYGDRLVDLVTVLSGANINREMPPVLVGWDDDDELDPLLNVVYGRIGQASDYERAVHGYLTKSLRIVDASSDELLSHTSRRLVGPLQLGMWSVEHSGLIRESGVAVIDPFSASDLVKLWNLRAAGNAVLPWPKPWDERVASFTRSRLSSLPLNRWGQEEETYTVVFTANREIPSDLRDLLDSQQRDSVHIDSRDLGSRIHHGSGIVSGLVRYFDVGIDRGSGGGVSAAVPLPHTGMVARDARYGLQYCAARISIHLEQHIGERVSFRAPACRQLATDLRWAVNVTSPVVRGVGDGIVVACSITNEQELMLGAIDSVFLIGRLLKAAGLEARISDAGRWTARIVDMLGGASSTLAAQLAVRAVLDLAARDGGANPEELHNAARCVGGVWEQHASPWLQQTPYARWVVSTLAARRLIEAHLTYTCGACGLAQRITPEQVQPSLTCNDCDHQTQLSLQVILGARWKLRTRSLLSQKRLRSAFPVAATILLLRQLQSRGDGANLHYALGLDLKRSDADFEIDYAAFLQDERGPALIIGEGKARNDFDDDDISNLETVQEAVRDLGVECFIAVSNSKTSLARGEIARLRSSADRFLLGINESLGRGGYVTLPLILTKSELTVPDSDDAHPLRLIRGGSREVDELARWSNERSLGLNGYGDPKTRTLSWGRADVAEGATNDHTQ